MSSNTQNLCFPVTGSQVCITFTPSTQQQNGLVTQGFFGSPSPSNSQVAYGYDVLAGQIGSAYSRINAATNLTIPQRAATQTELANLQRESTAVLNSGQSNQGKLYYFDSAMSALPDILQSSLTGRQTIIL
jgi:hypothetical protein